MTHRIGVIAGLRWDMNDDHTFRIAYTYDRARHRQTGEVGQVKPNGEPFELPSRAIGTFTAAA